MMIKIMSAVLNLIYRIHKLFPVQNRISFISREYDEPDVDITMLADELKKQSSDTDVVICCRMIGDGWFQKLRYGLHLCTTQMHLLATSRVVILDSYCMGVSLLTHKKSLKVVQMWHALGAFKAFGYTAIDRDDGRDAKTARQLKMHRGYDVIFVSSELCRKPMAQSFGYDESAAVVMPLPRVDLLQDQAWRQETREQILQAYPQMRGHRVVLYAPTIRRGDEIIDYAEQLEKAFRADPDTILVMKFHPVSHITVRIGTAISDTQFTTMQLLTVSDYVITDYSSVIFEAALIGNPVIRYVPDRAAYDHDRGFLIDTRKMPFPVFESAGQTAETIRSGNASTAGTARQWVLDYVEPGTDHTGRMAAYILKLSNIRI